MSLVSLLKFIANHPLNRQHKIKAISRFAKWQINSRLNPYPVVYNYTDRTKLIIQRSMTGATGNLYCGLHEFNDMGFLLHFLRSDDLFIDIGANIGSYTILAAGHIGASVVSVEPVPKTFEYLKNNIAINQIDSKVVTHNLALGHEMGLGVAPGMFRESLAQGRFADESVQGRNELQQIAFAARQSALGLTVKIENINIRLDDSGTNGS